MVDKEILDVINNYLKAVQMAGIAVQGAVLYGSYARGEENEFSDIDLIVIAPEFDHRNTDLVNRLWELRIYTDARIEPIATGVRQWAEDDGIPLLEIARREGIPIPFEIEPA